jgi:integrase
MIKDVIIHKNISHHNLDEYLDAYIREAGITADGKGYLFRTIRGRSKELTDNPMSQPDAYRMIRRRAAGVKILTKIGNHSLRATGITEYLRNGGMLEVAQQMANHESARTTGLYDRRNDQVSLDENEWIRI